jgi:TolB-like protein/DNA-binding winged helix-turn-helix (wHTH) protein/Tfp pilus assembly protein PilF
VASPVTSVGVIRFGDFESDLRSRELRRQGAKLRLPDQSFLVLAMLLERPGELVSREEIQKRLWPSDTFVDFDHGLNNAVARLREALGDSAETPHFIETLPRRGYRFIGKTNGLPQPEQAPAEAASLQPAGSTISASTGIESRRTHRRWIVAVSLSLLLIPAGLYVNGRRRSPSEAPIRSLAVLPLQNLSGDTSQDYFSDGLTDSLITELAHIRSLRVISRTSAMHYKGSRLSLPEIAQELKVDAALEGSVVRSGNRIRVTAQLVHAPTDRHLWAKAYDRDISEILSVQKDLVQSIAREIRAELIPAERNRLSSAPPVNPEAYEALLKGRYYWNKRSLEGFNKGLAFFRRAIDADPSYAPAYAGMAYCYNFLGLGMGSEPPREAAQKAKAAAQKALELDENLAEAHGALAFTLHTYEWNWVEAEREYRQALELDPQNVIIRGWFIQLLSFLGRNEEAQAQRESVRDLDPHSIQAVRAVAVAYGAAGQNEKAIDYYKKAIASEPDSFRLRMDLGGDYLASKRYEDAAQEFQKVLTLYGPNVYPLARLGYTYALWGKTAEAERILNELKREARPGYVSYAIAEICEALGRREEALRWLEKAYDERAAQTVTGLRWGFPSLRSDRRFQNLARRAGVPLDPQESPAKPQT